MPGSHTDKGRDASEGPPPLRLAASGEPDEEWLPSVIQWFLDHDQRVAIIKHPKVEELFPWKQEESRRQGENVYMFDRAEDRLAIGIMRAAAEYADERELHGWISQLLNALGEASKENEERSAAYKLDMGSNVSVVKEAAKIPDPGGREEFLTDCWLEALCTAELRVLGWVYQELYGRPYSP